MSEQSPSDSNPFWKDSILLNLSRFFERSAYYGFRSILLFYLLSHLSMDSKESYLLYGWFTSGIVVLALVCGILGDLLKINKWLVVLGGILQFLGTFSFTVQSIGVYPGLILIGIGTAFVSPNILAQFGKNALQKINTLNISFIIYFLVINLAALLSVIAISWVGLTYTYTVSFIACGLLFFLAWTTMIFTEKEYRYATHLPYKQNALKSIFICLGGGVLVVLFWFFFELYQTNSLTILSSVSDENIAYISGTGVFISGVVLIGLLLLARLRSYSLLAIGFILFSAGVFSIAKNPGIVEQLSPAPVYLGLILIIFSEMLVAPIAYALMTKYGHPRYLATIFAVVSILVLLGNRFANHLAEGVIGSSLQITLQLVGFVTLLIAIILFVGGWLLKKLSTTETAS